MFEFESRSGLPRTYKFEAIRRRILTFNDEVNVVRHERVRMVYEPVTSCMLLELNQQRFHHLARIEEACALMGTNR
jgi:hypothetical protein